MCNLYIALCCREFNQQNYQTFVGTAAVLSLYCLDLQIYCRPRTMFMSEISFRQPHVGGVGGQYYNSDGSQHDPGLHQARGFRMLGSGTLLSHVETEFQENCKDWSQKKGSSDQYHP